MMRVLFGCSVDLAVSVQFGAEGEIEIVLPKGGERKKKGKGREREKLDVEKGNADSHFPAVIDYCTTRINAKRKKRKTQRVKLKSQTGRSTRRSTTCKLL